MTAGRVQRFVAGEPTTAGAGPVMWAAGAMASRACLPVPRVWKNIRTRQRPG